MPLTCCVPRVGALICGFGPSCQRASHPTSSIDFFSILESQPGTRTSKYWRKWMSWLERRESWRPQSEDARDDGDIDYGRIIHSGSFRRLQGKTKSSTWEIVISIERD